MARNGTPREQISAGLRFDILRRCNFACYYCGIPAALGLKVLHVDHVIPVSLGGTNDPWNLVAACWDCNLGKSDCLPSADLVQRVREEWMVGSRLQNCTTCRFCGVPVMFADDEPRVQCDRCETSRMDAYIAGGGL